MCVTKLSRCLCTWYWIAVHPHTCMKCPPRLSDNDTAALSAALPPASKACRMPCHSLVRMMFRSGNLPGISLSSPCLCRGIDIDCRNTAQMELPSIWYIASSIRKRAYRDTTVQTRRRDKITYNRNSGSPPLHCTPHSTRKSLARLGRAWDLYLVCHTLCRPGTYILNTGHRTHTVSGYGQLLYLSGGILVQHTGLQRKGRYLCAIADCGLGNTFVQVCDQRSHGHKVVEAAKTARFVHV